MFSYFFLSLLFSVFFLRRYNNDRRIMLYPLVVFSMQSVKHKNVVPTYWKTALFFLSSSNPKKVNGAMNTNINNKKFKLVPLRNQPMQAFACKQECV